jgi:hypothetical protein
MRCLGLEVPPFIYPMSLVRRWGSFVAILFFCQEFCGLATTSFG